MKLNSVFFALLPMLLNIYNVNPTTSPDNIEDIYKKHPEAIVSFISTNFDKFKYEYNLEADVKWKANYIENAYSIIIDNIDDQYEGYFINFDRNNGYAVIGNDLSFLDFQVTGIDPYIDISDNYNIRCYSPSLGYLYWNDERFVNVDNSKETPEDYLESLDTFDNTETGQIKGTSGCGHILNTDKYIEHNYGSGFNLIESKSLTMATGNYTTQYYLSCYKTNKIQNNMVNKYSEGNCWFVSAYNILQSLADATGDYKEKRESMMISKDTVQRMEKSNEFIYYDPSTLENKYYSTIYDQEGNNISGKAGYVNNDIVYNKELIGSHIEFPYLYRHVRYYVVNKWNKTDGGTVYNTATIINSIGKQYGYNFKAKGTILAGLYGNKGFSSIKNNLPFGLCVSSVSNAGYGSHIMAGCGYKIYLRETGFWIFKVRQYKYFYELRDGHANTAIYLDFSSLFGYGGIIYLNW